MPSAFSRGRRCGLFCALFTIPSRLLALACDAMSMDDRPPTDGGFQVGAARGRRQREPARS